MTSIWSWSSPLLGGKQHHNKGCLWLHKTAIMYALKSLGKNIFFIDKKKKTFQVSKRTTVIRECRPLYFQSQRRNGLTWLNTSHYTLYHSEQFSCSFFSVNESFSLFLPNFFNIFIWSQKPVEPYFSFIDIYWVLLPWIASADLPLILQEMQYVTKEELQDFREDSMPE